jgi:hypothetical protein
MRHSFHFHLLRLATGTLLAALWSPVSPAQGSTPHQAGLDPRNFDATQFGELVTLGPNWLFAAGDNADYASPTFDDSAWKTISAEKQLTDYGIQDTPYAWYRIHIHLRPGTQNLTVGMVTVRGFYAVYANGVLVGSNGEGVAGLITVQRALTDYPIPNNLLAGRDDLVIAIRCSLNWDAHVGLRVTTPIGANSIHLIDQFSAPVYASYLAAHTAGPPGLLCGIALIAGLIALALFFALRSQMEYLAIAVCLFASSLNAAMLVWFSLGSLSFPLFCVQFVVIGAEMVALIEFVRLVLNLSRSRWLLALEIVSFTSFLIYPLHDVGFVSDSIFFVVFFIPVLLMKIVLPLLLIRGWRRGNREALLLLPAILLGCFADYWNFLRNVVFYAGFSSLLKYLPFSVSMGSYEIDFYRLGDLAFYIAILLFLVGRTVRIARERSLAAAELEAARTVQQVLIPDDIPTIPGFVLQSTYKPAGHVGGDFFQIIPLKGGSVLVVIGDVSGKGMPAAMTVSLLVGTVRTLAHYTQNPGQILAAMNQRMLARSGGGFTTCLVLRADRDGTLTIANAGHISPYLAGKELAIENGLPLGLAADAAYSESVFQLATGEQLTLLSDGVVEARDKTGALFGFERAAAITGQSAEEIAKAAELFGQEDDITALTLARTA